MLEKQRKQIDEIDAELVKLFEKRMDLVTEIGEIKKAHNLAIFDENRERKVIQKVQSQLHNKVYEQAVGEFFQGLMDTTKNFQQKIISK